MKILDSTVISNSPVPRTYLINITTGDLIVTVEVDEQSFNYPITEYSFITFPADSVATFALNGDTASISRG